MTLRALIGSSVAVVVLATSARAQGPTCADGRTPFGHLGFRWLHCPNGGPCWIASEDASERWFDLTVIPLVRIVDPAGPAAGLLRDGDAILSVDGQLTTSSQGGRALASLEPGRTVVLRIERHGLIRDVKVRPTASCRPIGLAVNSATDSAEFQHIIGGGLRHERRSPKSSAVDPPSPIIRRVTPRLDFEVEGPVPQFVVDPATGVVTIVLGATRIRVTPKQPKKD